MLGVGWWAEMYLVSPLETQLGSQWWVNELVLRWLVLRWLGFELVTGLVPLKDLQQVLECKHRQPQAYYCIPCLGYSQSRWRRLIESSQCNQPFQRYLCSMMSRSGLRCNYSCCENAISKKRQIPYRSGIITERYYNIQQLQPGT